MGDHGTGLLANPLLHFVFVLLGMNGVGQYDFLLAFAGATTAGLVNIAVQASEAT